ncbi:hypothetical protein FACS189490_04330 [Clostridia bacterium]|nr:hypothetical protein FACS189490_04330 [Clostridia bacterium]
MAISLFEHNQKAYESAVSLMEETGKAAIIHPTGTGKSFIGFKLAEENPHAVICWLSPSDYIFKTQLENLRDASNGYAPENILFFTYAKLMFMTDDEFEAILPDYIVLGEFHRCGASEWGKGVQKLLNLYANVPILGLSATNIRYLDNQRDMADELFDGNIASEMTLGEAIVRGMLLPPTYVLSIYAYEKELEKHKRRVAVQKNIIVREKSKEKIEELCRAIASADGLDKVFHKYIKNKSSKFIAFCSNAEHAKEIAECVPKWLEFVDKEPHVYIVYSAEPTSEKAFETFKEDFDPEHIKLLICVDMLNVGVHVENISGVMMFRPTISPIIYKQQLGRALSASKTKDPIVFDLVNNFESLYSLGTIEDEMRMAIGYYMSTEHEGYIKNETFTIYDETRDCREIFTELQNTLSTSWEEGYSATKAYFDAYGNLSIPKRYKSVNGIAVGSWVNIQRRVRAGKIFGILTADRIKKLDEISMIWESNQELTWGNGLNHAKKYYEKNGNLEVAVVYVDEDGFRLGTWLANVRQRYQKGLLTDEEVSQLNELSMVWQFRDFAWERNFSEAEKYFREHGDLNVKADYITDTGMRLGRWIQHMRTSRKSGILKLTDTQLEQLASIAIEWDDILDVQWKRAFEEAKLYFEENGHLNSLVYFKTKSGFALGQLLDRQRKAAVGKGHHDKRRIAERKELLNSIGMIWEEDSWEKRYALLEAYKNEHGSVADISQEYVVEGIWLGKWLAILRRIKTGEINGRSLTEEQVQKLETLGVKWDYSWKEETWAENYAEAVAYFNEHGNSEIPQNYVLPNGKKLGLWIAKQRRDFNDGKLSEEKIKKLNNIDMRFDNALELQWEMKYAAAKAYFEKHGDLKVPNEFRTENGITLGVWINNLKQTRKNCLRKISKEQLAMLDNLNMVWSIESADENWNSKYSLLQRYFKERGNSNAPYDCVFEQTALGEWVRTQRKRYKKGTLQKERVKKLEALKFKWDYSWGDEQWDLNFETALKYKEHYGVIDAPVTYIAENGRRIGLWFSHQRGDYRYGRLSQDRIQKLEDAGIHWQVPSGYYNRNRFEDVSEG